MPCLNDWISVAVSPPEKMLEVRDEFGNIGNGYPCYYNFRIEKQLHHGKWQCDIMACEKYQEGWVLMAEGLESPLKGVVTHWREKNNRMSTISPGQNMTKNYPEFINVLSNFIDAESMTPPNKEGWRHSDQVVVWYESVPNEKVSTYGIAYYHYSPPYGGPNWVDFSNFGRKPKCWAPIMPLPNIVK